MLVKETCQGPFSGPKSSWQNTALSLQLSSLSLQNKGHPNCHSKHALWLVLSPSLYLDTDSENANNPGQKQCQGPFQQMSVNGVVLLNSAAQVQPKSQLSEIDFKSREVAARQEVTFGTIFRMSVTHYEKENHCESHRRIKKNPDIRGLFRSRISVSEAVVKLPTYLKCTVDVCLSQQV